MQATSFLENINFKNKPFDRSLWLNYVQERAARFLGRFQKLIQSRLIKKLSYQLDEMTILLHNVYKQSAEINPGLAEEIYPNIEAIQKTITNHNKRFREINYANNPEIKKQFIQLVRLSNRICARLHGRIYHKADPVYTPDYIKEKTISNSREITGNVLHKETNY